MQYYTPERANNECGGCEYHLTDMEFTQTQSSDNTDIIKSDQTCGRVLKRKREMTRKQSDRILKKVS